MMLINSLTDGVMQYFFVYILINTPSNTEVSLTGCNFLLNHEPNSVGQYRVGQWTICPVTKAFGEVELVFFIRPIKYLSSFIKTQRSVVNVFTSTVID